MLEKISLILAGLSLLAILFIVIRKFPVLAVLNIDNLPGEKEASFKKEIIKKRLDRDLSRVGGVFSRVWLFLDKRVKYFLSFSEKNLKKIKTNYRRQREISWLDKSQLIKELSLAAETAAKKNDENLAEEKLLEIISLDQKNLSAFVDLGKLYQQSKKWPEASQTFRHALKLAAKRRGGRSLDGDPILAEIYFSLAIIGRDSDNLEAALNDISEALELETNNPRYLDLILDLSIMKKDRELASRYLEKMRVINPENQKLAVWEESINNL
jgi:tetratricopeptide (TPR) repeat protein